ncbi:MAG: rhomboid family intramembrane serine protease [Flavobacteriales bacterium]|nr:rhomboid family intramembrane serine protease [Flavobacteriales bacterium]
MSVTLVIIILTALVSASAFGNRELFYRFSFSPYQVKHRSEWWRLLTHAVIHADWMHLIVNMFVLFNFGRLVELYFDGLFLEKGVFFYILLYVGGVAFASIPGLKKQGDNAHYNAVGASGAVSAVLFTSIILQPMSKIYIMFIPIGIPAFIFGPLYIGLEIYLDKRSGDNVAHDAHYWGAFFGFLFPIVLEPKLFSLFISQILG